jgi:hypothetical protein
MTGIEDGNRIPEEISQEVAVAACFRRCEPIEHHPDVVLGTSKLLAIGSSHGSPFCIFREAGAGGGIRRIEG